MKALGIALMVMAIGWIGEQKRGRMKTRVRSLEMLIDHLTQISGWIDFDHRTLPDMLADIAALPDAAATLFGQVCQRLKGKPFPRAWEQTVAEQRESLALNEQDAQALLWLGGMLGQFDGETQVQAIGKTVGALQRQRQLAWDEWQKKGRVYRTFFWSLGMMAALVLL